MRRTIATVTTLLTVLCLAHFSRGGDEGITVTSTGSAKGMPSVVEMNCGIAGEAELSADALVKYRDARRRAVAAIEALKVDGLTIDSDGFGVSQAVDPNAQQMMMRGMPANAAAKPKVAIGEQFRIVIKGVDKIPPEAMMQTLLKVIDGARDAGLNVGGGSPMNVWQMQMAMQNGQGLSMLSFKLANVAEYRQQALKGAMDDARAKAQRLADLAGVKLGGVLSVHDSGSIKKLENPQAAYYRAAYGIADTDDPDSEVSTGIFAPVTVKVNLTVRFEASK